MRTCTACRAKVEEEEGTMNAAARFVCAECAEDERAGAGEAAECPECGDPIEDKKAESCVSCGAELKPGDDEEEEEV